MHPAAVWGQIQAATVANRLQGTSSVQNTISGVDFFGLSRLSIRNFIERLVDAGGCSNYTFVAAPPALVSTPSLNPTGCCRTELVRAENRGSTELVSSQPASRALVRNVAASSSAPAMESPTKRSRGRPNKKQRSEERGISAARVGHVDTAVAAAVVAAIGAGGGMSAGPSQSAAAQAKHFSQMAQPMAAAMLPDAMSYRLMKQVHKTTATRRTEVRRSPIHAWGLYTKVR